MNAGVNGLPEEDDSDDGEPQSIWFDLEREAAGKGFWLLDFVHDIQVQICSMLLYRQSWA